MYTPQEIESGKKVWGVSSQLYSVRSRDNWGIGDFADLRQLLLGDHRAVEILTVKPTGKKEMPAADFINGLKNKTDKIEVTD